MTTRRNILKGGAGLAAILAAQSAPAILVRSMVAARGSFFGMGGGAKIPTAADYVQDGLIAMWDGIENAGWGVHDANATVWKDLIGTRDATLSGSFAWGPNFWDVRSVSGMGLATWDGTNLPVSQTWEIVIHPSATSGYGRIIAEGGQGVASPVIENRSNRLYMYGYGRDNASDPISGYSNLDLHSHVIVHPSGGPFYYYIDGVQKWTQTTSTDSIGFTSAFFANRANLQRGLDAKYYSVRLYARALTAAEIAANNAVDKARFNLA